MAANRRTVREAIATAMTSYLTNAEAIYNYKPDDVGGQFPVVAIESTAVSRPRERFKSNANEFSYTVHLFVLYGSESQGWTKEQADDALDDLEYQFAQFVEANVSNASWRDIQYAGQSVILDDVKLGGEQYINEQIPILVSV